MGEEEGNWFDKELGRALRKTGDEEGKRPEQQTIPQPNWMHWFQRHLNWVIIISYIVFIIFAGLAQTITLSTAKAGGLGLALLVSIVLIIPIGYSLSRIEWATINKGYKVFSGFWGSVLLVIIVLIPLVGIIVLLIYRNGAMAASSS